jgi:hypothetical protein
MSSEIRVPTLGESVTEATIAQWYKKPGDAVAIDEPLCELETDKVTIEVPAQSAGVLAEVTVAEGEHCWARLAKAPVKKMPQKITRRRRKPRLPQAPNRRLRRLLLLRPLLLLRLRLRRLAMPAPYRLPCVALLRSMGSTPPKLPAPARMVA